MIRNLYCKSVNIFSCQSYIHFSAPIFQNAQMAKTLKRFIHCRRICKNAKSIFVFSQLQQNFLVCQFISRFSISVSELRLFSAPICQSVFRTTSPWQMAKTMKEYNCRQMCPENHFFRSILAKICLVCNVRFCWLYLPILSTWLICKWGRRSLPVLENIRFNRDLYFNQTRNREF